MIKRHHNLHQNFEIFLNFFTSRFFTRLTLTFSRTQSTFARPSIHPHILSKIFLSRLNFRDCFFFFLLSTVFNSWGNTTKNAFIHFSSCSVSYTSRNPSGGRLRRPFFFFFFLSSGLYFLKGLFFLQSSFFDIKGLLSSSKDAFYYLFLRLLYIISFAKTNFSK